jgi:hypothetical protein
MAPPHNQGPAAADEPRVPHFIMTRFKFTPQSLTYSMQRWPRAIINCHSANQPLPQTKGLVQTCLHLFGQRRTGIQPCCASPIRHNLLLVQCSAGLEQSSTAIQQTNLCRRPKNLFKRVCTYLDSKELAFSPAVLHQHISCPQRHLVCFNQPHHQIRRATHHLPHLQTNTHTPRAPASLCAAHASTTMPPQCAVSG